MVGLGAIDSALDHHCALAAQRADANTPIMDTDGNKDVGKIAPYETDSVLGKREGGILAPDIADMCG